MTARATVLALAMIMAASGCGNNIRAIRFHHGLVARPPARPAAPAVVNDKPVKPSMLKQKKALEVRRLPNLQRRTIGFVFHDVALPAGVKVDGAEADAPLLLTMGLLRAGASRFFDLRLLRQVAAVAAGRDAGGLTLTASLDHLTMLGLYRRVDHVLAVQSLRCDTRQAQVKISRRWAAKDLTRYETRRKAYEAEARTYTAVVDAAVKRLRKSYSEEVERYSGQWEQRSFKERFGDFFSSEPDDRKAASSRLATAQARLRRLRTKAALPLKGVKEIVAGRPLSPLTRSLVFHRCRVRATLADVRSGDTLWAYSGVQEAGDPAKALGGALEMMIESLLSRSRLPRPKIISETSRQVASE